MPKAEVGSTKYLNNKLKSKGLQRLRWYCQACERQMRDENGFKMHTQSESHVRQMLVVGENSKKFINDFSRQFQHDFLQLLRTAHGEKKVNLNHFYQEYIANKEHVHMNATRWTGLMEFGKYLGREGICRVEEGDKGLEVAWIDNSPEALRRQDAIRKKERQDRGDEERELRLVAEQVERARRDAEEKKVNEEQPEEARLLQREEGEKIKLKFGSMSTSASAPPAEPSKQTPPGNEEAETPSSNANETPANPPKPEKLSLDLGGGGPSKPKNVFAAASKKSSAKGAKGPANKLAPQKHMSEAERIMKEEIERKRAREARGGGGGGGGFGPPGKRIRMS